MSRQVFKSDSRWTDVYFHVERGDVVLVQADSRGQYIDDMVFCLFDDGVAAWSKHIYTDKYVHIGEFD